MREIREERHHLQEVMMATQSRQAEVSGENFTVARTLDWLVNCFQKLWKTGWKLDFISFFLLHTETMRSLYCEAWDKAKQARVNQRAIRNTRKKRQAHERSFAQVGWAITACWGSHFQKQDSRKNHG
jgi:hypothetical protein